MKRILLISDNYLPEVNAPATRCSEHALVWSRLGYNVTVLTSNPNFPAGKLHDGFKNRLLQVEWYQGIRIIRVWTLIHRNEGIVLRSMDQFSFLISSFLIGIFLRFDIILATSPNFFAAISGHLISKFRRVPWIMEVRDIWPESIVAVGALKNGTLLRILEKIELRLYRSSARIVVVTDAFKRLLVSRKIDSKKIYVHKNGVILNKFLPIEKNSSILNNYPQLNEKTVIGYIGTMGMAHGLDFIIKMLPRIAVMNSKVHFVFIGDGSERKRLIDLANGLFLTNVTFIDPVPKNEIRNYISVIDFALVNLSKTDTFKTVIPSKIFELCAMEKPILLGVSGESKEIIESFSAGVCFEPEDETSFMEEFIRICSKKNQHVYVNGCRKLAESFDRQKIATQMAGTIQEVLEESRS